MGTTVGLMNNRKPKYHVVSVMTDDAKYQGVYIIKAFTEPTAKSKALDMFLKNSEHIEETFTEVVYKTRSKHDADVFLHGYSEGSSNQLGV